MAARFGAKAIGYELNPVLVAISRLLGRPFGGRIEVKLTDFWFAPLPSDVTVIYLFAVTRDRKRISRKLQKEVDRIGRPISVLTLGSGLQDITPDGEFDAYHRYTLQPGSRHV